MMTMPKKAMAKMTMAVVPVMAVASTVPAMPVTAGEGLTGDGQGSRGQCQSRDSGGDDRLGLRHGRLLLSWGRARVALR